MEYFVYHRGFLRKYMRFVAAFWFPHSIVLPLHDENRTLVNMQIIFRNNMDKTIHMMSF